MMRDILTKESHKTSTYNGANVYDTSFDNLTDLFAKIGSMRHVDDPTELFERAFKEDPITATRILFYARDCRGGYGERKTVFKIFYDFFCVQHPEWGEQLVHWFAEMGRWKDLWDIVAMLIKDKGMEAMLDDTRIDYPRIADKLFDVIMEQFNDDVTAVEAWKNSEVGERPNISMLGKWMPSCHSQSPNVRNQFKWFSKNAQGLTYCMGEKYYRYYTKTLREHIGIVEHKIVSKDYASIDYTKIPSRALKRYTTLFKKYDADRFNEIMNKAANPEENPEIKLNVRQLYPYEILGDVYFRYFGSVECKAGNTETAMWYQMPNFFKRDVSILPVLDTSGSMNGTKSSIATSLAIYTAQRNSHEVFRNYVMQFSDRPHLVSIKDKHSLADIIKCFEMDNASTDFEGVMMYLLDLAASNNVPPEEMPEYLLIISDMQFNDLASIYDSEKDPTKNRNSHIKIPMMDKIRSEYNKTPYKLPTMIYWNVDDDAPKGSFPMAHLDGCIYISGRTPIIFEHLFDERFPSTYELIKKITDSDRYNKITIDFTKQD